MKSKSTFSSHVFKSLYHGLQVIYGGVLYGWAGASLLSILLLDMKLGITRIPTQLSPNNSWQLLLRVCAMAYPHYLKNTKWLRSIASLQSIVCKNYCQIFLNRC